MQSMEVGLVQMDIQWEDKESNLSYIQELILTNKHKLDLIVLPEMFSTGFTMNAKDLAEEMNGPTVAWMLDLSKTKQVALCGSLIISHQNRFYNRFIWVEPDGKIRYYDKKHLFALAGEDHIYSQGMETNVFSYQAWRVCPQICYDLRFPEWQRSALPFDLLVFVASWPDKRLDAWRHLLKARAIENQCYVIGVNRLGTDGNNLSYSGSSLVIGPDGSIVLDAEQASGIFVSSMFFPALQQLRESLPFLKDRSRITFD
jgi:omega-amidase